MNTVNRRRKAKVKKAHQERQAEQKKKDVGASRTHGTKIVEKECPLTAPDCIEAVSASLYTDERSYDRLVDHLLGDVEDFVTDEWEAQLDALDTAYRATLAMLAAYREQRDFRHETTNNILDRLQEKLGLQP